MISPSLIKTFVADAAIGARLLVASGSADANAALATASTAKIIGVSDMAAAAATGDKVDVILSGTAELLLGGTVTRGDPVTADANGKGVTAAPATGVNARYAGFALSSGVAGDIIPFLLSQGIIQG